MTVLHAGWHRSQVFLWAAGCPTGELAVGAVELRNVLLTVLSDLKALDAPRALEIWLPNVESPSAAHPHHHPMTVFGVPLRGSLLVSLMTWIHQHPEGTEQAAAGPELKVIADAYWFANRMVRAGSYIPGLVYRLGYFRPMWKPWWTTPHEAYVEALSARLPDVARALGNPAPAAKDLIRQWIEDVVDTMVRDAIEPPPIGVPGPYGDWLSGLVLKERGTLEPRPAAELLARGLKKWDEDARHRAEIPYRLCFRIEEHAGHASRRWYVRLLAEPLNSPELPNDPLTSGIETADWMELLDWAAHYSDSLAEALGQHMIQGFKLDTDALLHFIEHDAPLLKDAGASILLPAWWKGRKRHLALSARITPAPVSAIRIGDVNQVDWNLALGGDEISLEELQSLAASQQRLIQFHGQWIELEDDVVRWAQRLQSLPQQVDTGTAIRWGIEGQVNPGVGSDEEAIPATISTEGWMAEVISRLIHHESIEPVSPSSAFRGKLRPYQLRGLAWLDFLHRFGLGCCLADDMGLGKTIQALALVDRDYQNGERKPVLLVCPTSVVANWQREAQRFTPALPVHVHQGPDRLRGRELIAKAKRIGLFVTSYPLLRADSEELLAIEWYGVILDEAQNIKNSSTHQSQIACRLPSEYRVALTGTPLENRLEELWALMRFLNPGLLGSQEAFRRRYGNLNNPDASSHELTPLQRHIEPFFLRRVKTDPSIIDDLPDKIEIKEFCHVTREQASLYQAVLDTMTREIDTLEGIGRRGLILTTLTRLKQILNHPAHYLADHSPLPGRSGKLTRLDELLEEVLGENHRALIFTQFTEMGGAA